MRPTTARSRILLVPIPLLALASALALGAAPRPAAARTLPAPPPAQARTDNPYRFVLVVDEDPRTRALAQDFIALLQAVPVFRRMGKQIEFQLVQLPAKEMACGNSVPKSPRLIVCDPERLEAAARQASGSRPVHRVLAFTSRGRGGSGGRVIAASLNHPRRTMLHELLHSYGFGDEYEYGEEELEYNCTPPRWRSNIVSFRPARSPFESEAQARLLHAQDIPWFNQIGAETPITTDHELGTAPGLLPPTQAALYRGGGCDRKVPTWRPYAGANIMSTLETAYIPESYERQILRRMSSERGEAIQLLPPMGEALPSSRSVDATPRERDYAPAQAPAPAKDRDERASPAANPAPRSGSAR